MHERNIAGGVFHSVRRSILAALVLTLAPLSARATVYQVQLTADDANLGANGNCTLREAILAANGNAAVDACAAGTVGEDTILLAAGTYTLTIPGRGEDLNATGDLDIREALKVLGSGASTTTISAAGLGDRVLQVTPGVAAYLQDVTVSGGRLVGSTNEPVTGGGIWNDGNLTLLRAVVTDNQAIGGPGASNPSTPGGASGAAGGIFNSATASLTLDVSLVSFNRAIGGNGGFYCCSMSCSCNGGGGGGSARAGGIENQGSVSMRGSTITDNAAAGGAIGGGFPSAGGAQATGGGLASFAGQVEILDTMFARNAASGGSGATGGGAQGGALYVGGGTLDLEQSLVAENTASAAGAILVGAGGSAAGSGIVVAAGAIANVTNSTLSKNLTTAGNGGTLLSSPGGNASGGALQVVGTAVVSNCTLAENKVTSGAGGAGGAAGGAVGGALDSDGATTVVNAIVAANQAAVVGGATTDEACNGTIAAVSLGGNLESPADTCGFHGLQDQASVAPLALSLQPLASNGGATFTQALGLGSVAINAGLAAACPTFDQRHYARSTSVCDIGAYEFGAAPCTDADHDGYSVEGGACGPIDCNDGNPNVNPGAVDIPGSGVDEDCNAFTPGCLTPTAEASVRPAARGASGAGETVVAAALVFAGMRGLRRLRRVRDEIDE